MRAVLKIAINNIKKKKLQSILSLLIIMTAAVLFSISLNLLFSVNKPFGEMHKNLNAFDNKININPNIENLNKIVNLFKNDSRVKEIQVDNCYSGDDSPKINGVQLKENYMIAEKANKNIGIDRLITLEGDKGKSPKPNEVWLAKDVADNDNIKLNDTVYFNINGKRISRKIGALIVDPSYGSSYMGICRFWVGKGELSKMLPKRDINKSIEITFKKCGDGTDVNLSIENKLGRPIIGTCVKYSLIKLAYTEAFNIMGAILGVIAGFILIFTLIIIMITITSLIFNDYKNIGIESSIGFTKLQIIINYMLSFFMLAIVSSIIGILIGNAFSNVYMQRFYSSLGFAKVTLPLFKTSIITISIISIFILVSSFIASISIIKISPVKAIRDGASPVKDKRKNTISLMTMKGLNLDFSLAIKDLLNNVKQNLLLFILIGAAVYMTAFCINTRYALKNVGKNAAYWGFEKSDISLTAKNNVTRSKILKDMNDIKRDTKAAEVANFYAYYVSIPKTDEFPSSNTMTFVYDSDFDSIGLENVTGKNPRQDDEISISTKLSSKYKKDVGDYFTIYINGNKKSFLITGIYQNSFNAGENIRLKDSIVSKLDASFKDKVPAQSSIIIKDKANTSKMFNKIKDKYNNNYYIETGNQYLSNHISGSLAPISGILMVIIISFVIVAVFCIFNFNLINIYAYKKTLGIYKSLGFTNNEIVKIYAYKVLLITISSIILFLPIEKVTQSPVISTILSIMGIRKMPLSMCSLQIAASLIVFIILICISVIISCRTISNINTRDLVNE
ncbi:MULTISPECIES: ABC transporter permease [Clostridium]|uniref:ABC transporter permease n=1 Tax=Clostridium TaxID=1485 RepID=UPI000825F3D6|nr:MULTISPECIES: FtsX-like permease family protein [Clostridium]